MAAAHLRPHRRELAEVRQPLFLAHGLGDGREPGDVRGLDTELSDPFRLQQILVGLGNVFGFHQPRVVAHDGEEQIVRRVIAMARECLRRNVGERGAVELLEQVLAMQDLQRRPVALEDVDAVLARSSLGERALHELLIDCAPHAHLDAVLLLERGEKRVGVVEGHGRVQHDGALAFRLRHEPFGAVRALIEIDIAVRGRLLLRMARRDAERGEREE